MNKIKSSLDIRLVLFDVDGVMTDGTIYTDANGEIIKAFNVKDGLAIELLHSHGILTGIVSGKASAALDTRCKQLGFDVIVTGCKNKLPRLYEICDELVISPQQVAFVGDDVLDLPLFEFVGLSVAPSDAHELVLSSADWITQKKGGKGMVREFSDKLLCEQLNLKLEEVYAVLLDKIRINNVGNLEQ